MLCLSSHAAGKETIVSNSAIAACAKCYLLGVLPPELQVKRWMPRRRIRVFSFRTGRLTRIYDESLEAANELQRIDADLFKLDPIDFGRRMAVEKDLQAAETPLRSNAVFDESGNFLLYPTLLGIKAGSQPLPLGHPSAGTFQLPVVGCFPSCPPPPPGRRYQGIEIDRTTPSPPQTFAPGPSSSHGPSHLIAEINPTYSSRATAYGFLYRRRLRFPLFCDRCPGSSLPSLSRGLQQWGCLTQQATVSCRVQILMPMLHTQNNQKL